MVNQIGTSGSPAPRTNHEVTPERGRWMGWLTRSGVHLVWNLAVKATLSG